MDKNLGTVVLDKSDYLSEGHRQLNDTKFYRLVTHLPVDINEPFDRFVPEVNFLEDELLDIRNDHDDLLNVKDRSCMFATFPFKPAKFYLLPKLHKPLGPCTCGLKGRPIVSCINYCTSPASRFVDHHLRIVLLSLADTTILKDTTMLTNRLKTSSFPNNVRILTADVESLYTDMNWHDTIAAVDSLLVNHPLRNLLLDLLKFVVENNYFIFDILYHQEFGMAMGTPMAVNVANAFLFVHEMKSITTFKSSMHLFNRFIDDLILVIEESTNLAALQASLYSELPTIKLNWTLPSDSCIFLDLDIFKTSTNNGHCVFEFRTFQKPRNAYLYIPCTSDHPRANLRAFIKAELLRYNRTNSRLADIQNVRSLLWKRLRRRGYPPQFLASSFTDVLPTVILL